MFFDEFVSQRIKNKEGEKNLLKNFLLLTIMSL